MLVKSIVKNILSKEKAWKSVPKGLAFVDCQSGQADHRFQASTVSSILGMLVDIKQINLMLLICLLHS